jgi:hypothetical protein
MGRQSFRHALNDLVGAGASPWLYPIIPGAGSRESVMKKLLFGTVITMIVVSPVLGGG